MAYAQGRYFAAVDGYAADGRWRILFGQGKIPTRNVERRNAVDKAIYDESATIDKQAR